MDKCPNTCVTCLCNDRKLVPLKEMRNFLQYIQFTELNSVYGGICWECKNAILKFYRFKHKALLVQSNLSSKKVQNLKPLTNLGIKVNIPNNCNDPLNCENDSKFEIHIKVENLDKEESATENTNNYIPEIGNIKTEIKLTESALEISPFPVASKPHNHKDMEEQSQEDIGQGRSDKFIKFIRTEKQMLKDREEMKKNPNYENILFMPFKCHYCVLGFVTKKSYEEHVQKSHDESIGPYACHVCNVRFESMLDLEAHRKIHYVYYKCRFCKYTTSQECLVLNHCKVLHEKDGEIRLYCQQCKTVHRNEHVLEEHMKTHHSVKCNVCEMAFVNRYSLKKHRSQTHKSDFVCDICKQSFTAKSRLETHMTKHSALIAKNMSYCSECKVQFKSLGIYRNHIRTSSQHAKSIFPCSKCDKVFPSEPYLKRHYNYMHVHDAKHYCAACDKSFMLSCQLKNHNKVHHGMPRSRDHACNECGKKFFTNQLLRSHQLIHSEKRSYMCAQCGDTFKQKSAMYNHIRLVHKGEKKNK